jgi:exonuclease VII large subunit
MAKLPLEKTVNKRLKNVDQKLKTSFVLIRQDVDEMQDTVDAMAKYLKKKDKEYIEQKDVDEKIQEEFREDVDDFTQKIMQLKIALSEVRAIQREVVIKKDLARIEDRIKTSFKSDIESYKNQVKNLRLDLRESNKRISYLEDGKVFEKKQGFFFKRKKEE